MFSRLKKNFRAPLAPKLPVLTTCLLVWLGGGPEGGGGGVGVRPHRQAPPVTFSFPLSFTLSLEPPDSLICAIFFILQEHMEQQPKQ